MGSDLTVPTDKQTEKAAGKVTAQSSLTEDYNPIFQDIARFRGIIFDARLKSHGLTMSQGFVLANLWRENGLRQLDLSERMNVATVTISKLIDKLEAGGFVKRRPDAEDRRSNRIFATRKGLAKVKLMTKFVLEVDSIANQGVDPAELEIALRVLVRLRQNLKDEIAGS